METNEIGVSKGTEMEEVVKKFQRWMCWSRYVPGYSGLAQRDGFPEVAEVLKIHSMGRSWTCSYDGNIKA